MDHLISAREPQSGIRSELAGLPSLKDFMIQLSLAKYHISKMIALIMRVISSGHLTVHHLPLKENSYSRNILYRESSGFEVIAARWSKGAITPIHGHPGFSLLYLIEGQLSEDAFVKDNGEIMEIGQKTFSPGDFTFDKGEEGRLDNSIHKITADEDSMSLHIYSDDAIKGEIYSS